MQSSVSAASVLVIATCMCAVQGIPPGVDRTILYEEAGFDVVVATIEQLRQLGVFPNNNRLLRRIAYAETRDGVDFATYRQGYDGGIWQVDEAIFLLTQNTTASAELLPLLQNIQQLTTLDWLQLPWNELRRPFFSGMAASIYLTLIPEAIPGPGDIEGQGRYWKQHYNSDPEDTIEGFVKAVEEFESEECPLRGLDLAFIFDSSGSVGKFNFSVEKEFAVNITNVFNIGPDATQVGAVAFSGATYFTLPLDNLTSNQAVRDGLKNIPYNDFPIGGPSTNTSGALRTVRQRLFTEEGGARPLQSAFPRVVIVITDGRSNVDHNLTIPSAEALHNDNVIVFAVGIGQKTIRINELMGIASRPEFATLIGGFNVIELQGVQRVLSDEACRVPARVFVEDMVEVSTQLLGSVSYFQYELPEEGMTLRLNVAAGRVILYASTRIPNPNSALYDIRIETDSTDDVFVTPEDLLQNDGFIGVGRRKRLEGEGGRQRNSTGIMIYVSIEGLRGNNSYILETTFGDTSTSHAVIPHLSMALCLLTTILTLTIERLI